MKILRHLAAAAMLLALLPAANASYFIVDTVDVNQDVTSSGGAAWYHMIDLTNVPKSRILSATLDIVAEDVDTGEDISVFFGLNNLGYLNLSSVDTSTVFDLSPSWIEAFNLGAALEIASGDTQTWANIISSTLSVEVPEPATTALFALGLAAFGFVVARKKI